MAVFYSSYACAVHEILSDPDPMSDGCEWVVVGFHCGEFVFDFENRFRQVLECVMKPVWLHVFICTSPKGIVNLPHAHLFSAYTTESGFSSFTSANLKLFFSSSRTDFRFRGLSSASIIWSFISSNPN